MRSLLFLILASAVVLISVSVGKSSAEWGEQLQFDHDYMEAEERGEMMYDYDNNNNNDDDDYMEAEEREMAEAMNNEEEGFDNRQERKTKIIVVGQQQPEQVVAVPQQVVVAPQMSSGVVGGCFWVGTAPMCSAKCPSNSLTARADKKGDGRSCWTGTKKLCCPVVGK